jgi:hypothetical protein
MLVRNRLCQGYPRQSLILRRILMPRRWGLSHPGWSPLNTVASGHNMVVLAINLTFLFFARTMQKINMCFFAPVDYGGAI